MFYDERKSSPEPLTIILKTSLSKRHTGSSRYICCVYRAYKQIQAHYSCMRPKCTKFSHGTGGHVGDTRAPAQRCVLCLFLAEMCHMSLVPPFLVKSNGDTEVSPERQRFVNNSSASPFEIPFQTHRRFPRRSFNSFALDLLCQLLLAFHFEMAMKKLAHFIRK